MTHTCREIAWRRGFDAHRLSNVPFGVRWEDDLAAILPDPPKIALDVGANIGQTAQRLLERFPRLHIYSFEPNPEALAKLQAFAQRHGSIEVVGAAASDSAGEIALVMPDNSRHSTVTREAFPGERTGIVPTVRLDDFCGEHGIDRVSLLKIDAEGHELAVLRGAEKLLNRHRVDAVLLECEFAENRGQPHADFFAIHPVLNRHGYRVVAFYVGGVNGDGWKWGDVLYRLPTGDPVARQGPFA